MIYPLQTSLLFAASTASESTTASVSNPIESSPVYYDEYGHLNSTLPSSTTSTQDTTSTNPLSALQTIGLGPSQQTSLGPLSLSSQYDTLLGLIFGAQYAQKVSEDMAFGFIGEYGANQYRLNGTLGYEFLPDAQAKFSAEYLSQVLPFEFDSGDVNERADQSAYGLSLQRNFHNSLFRNVNFNGYWSKAPNVGLSDQVFNIDGLWYTNQRNLAGATAQGIDVGTDVNLSSQTLLGGKLYYDNVDYATEFTADSEYNASGLGGSLQLDQIVTDRVKFSVTGELRALYNSYGGSLSWAPLFAKAMGLHISFFAERLLSSNPTPDSNTYGIQLGFLSDEGEKSPAYSLSNAAGFGDIEQWVKDPAVYMDRVLIVAEQKTTLNAPLISELNPNSGPLTGGNTVLISGSNFLPGVSVSFNGTPGDVTLLSSSQLSVVVPALTFGLMATLEDIITKPVDVVVTNTDGQQTVFTLSYTYTNADAPALTSVSPGSGPTAGGQVITLTGTQLTGTTGVTIGDIAATDVTVTNDDTVMATTPAHAAGIVSIKITSPGGENVLPDSYTYVDLPTVTSISPTSGSTAGGTPVTIYGSNFVSGSTTVKFGTADATAVVVNAGGASLTATSPSGSAGTVDVIVTTPSGEATLSNGFTYIVPLICTKAFTSYSAISNPYSEAITIDYSMIGGGGGGSNANTDPTGGGGGGGSSALLAGSSVNVANGGAGGSSSAGGATPTSVTGSLTLGVGDTLTAYVGGGGGAGGRAGSNTPGGGGGSGYYGGGGGGGVATNGAGGSGAGGSDSSNIAAGGSVGGQNGSFQAGGNGGNPGSNAGSGGTGGTNNGTTAGGGGGYGGGGGNYRQPINGSGGAGGSNGDDGSEGGLGANNWSSTSSLTLPSDAGQGGAVNGGGNAGLVVIQYTSPTSSCSI